VNGGGIRERNNMAPSWESSPLTASGSKESRGLGEGSSIIWSRKRQDQLKIESSSRRPKCQMDKIPRRDRTSNRQRSVPDLGGMSGLSANVYANRAESNSNNEAAPALRKGRYEIMGEPVEGSPSI